MRLPTILFSTALWAAVVTPAFPQLHLPGGLSCKASGYGAFTMRFDLAPIVSSEPVTNAPYSAVRLDRSVQTLADGTHLTSNGRRETATWRDSEGRVRTEIHIAPGDRPGSSPCEASLVEIEDPVAWYVYLLDRVDQVAYRLPLIPLQRAIESARARKPASPQAQNSPELPAASTDSLGEKTMFGITVTGTRRTVTYPAGSTLGNDRAVTSIVEDWISPQLKIDVYSQRTEYDGRVNTNALKDLSVAEPDPALLQVPPGYRITDENGSFTITISGHN
ncbi:MAG TPA: hypothetical protein VGL82_04650 [Bryobacteraceae bacterium]|jgi:hypothetical protein